MNKTLRNMLWTLGGALLIVVIAVTIFIKFYLSPWLKETLERQGSASLGAPLKIESLDISLLPPLKAHAKGISLAVPKAGVRAQFDDLLIKTHLGLGALFGAKHLGTVELTLEKPQIEIERVAQQAEEKTSPPSTPSPEEPVVPRLNLARDLALKVHVRDGSLHMLLPEGPAEKAEAGQPTPSPTPIAASDSAQAAATPAPAKPNEITVSGLGFDLETESLNSLQAKISLELKAHLLQAGLDLSLPLKFNTLVKAQDDTVTLTGAKGDIGGIGLQADGQQNLKTGAGQWKLLASAPELGKLPVPPSFLPPGQWTGAVALEIQASSASKASGWTANGKIHLDKLSGQTQFKRDDISASGQVHAALDAAFSLQQLPELLIRVEKAALSADLSGLELEKKSVFKKPAGVPLTLDLNAAGDVQKLKIEKLRARFATLVLNASGLVSRSAQTPTSLAIAVDKTSLEGWETFFPQLASSPVKGSIQLAASVHGDIERPETLSVKINPLQLERIQANVEWISADGKQKISGPVNLDGSVILEAQGDALKTANVKLETDLSRMAIQAQDSFDKRAGVPLKLQLNATQRGEQIDLKTANLQLDSNRFLLSGQVSQPTRPKLALKLTTPGVNLSEMSSLLPKLTALNLAGLVNGSVDLSGVYDFKEGIEKSPLRVKADLKAQIPRFKIEKSKEAPVAADQKADKKKATAPTTAPADAEPILPSWPIAQTAIVKADVQIGELLYGDLPVKGIHVLSRLEAGTLQGSLAVEKVFKGSAKVTQFQTKLGKALPDAVADLEFKEIDLQEAAGAASPDWRELIQGSATGRAHALIAHPSRTDFLEQTSATGSIRIKNGFVSTLELDQLANSTIAKIPGIGQGQLIKSKGVAADIAADFSLERKVLKLGSFTFLTPEKNELRLKGTLGLDKSMDLVGDAYLATAPVGGSVREANSDASGRFVLPLRLKGNLLKPEASIAQETVSLLLKKTAELEVNKAKKNVQNKIEEEGKKQLDKLKEELRKKGLPSGIFGN